MRIASGRNLIGTFACTALVAVCACARPTPEFPASTAPLEALVPEGAQTLVFVDLAAVRASVSFTRSLDAVLAPLDRGIFETWLRVPLDQVDRVVLAVFPRGYVVLVEGASIDARRVVRDAGVQMGQIEVADTQPFLRRAGRLGVERREFVAIAQHRFVIGGEDGAAMIALLEAARGVSPSALDTPRGRALRQRLGDATISVAALEPLVLPAESDVAVLLARHEALGVALVPSTEPQWLTIRVGIVGTLPPGADHNLRLLAETVASSSLGGLFGMREGDEALVVSASDDGATIVHRIASASLANGLWEVFRAEIGEIGEGLPSGP